MARSDRLARFSGKTPERSFEKDAARERVRTHFLSDSSLRAYLALLAPLAARTPVVSAQPS